MPVEASKKLFLNEYNESKRGTNDEKGSGLGLVICKDFVHMHGGKIWAESEPDNGTTVSFTLPSPDNEHSHTN
jgi:signal transduction histidine kinase